MAFTPFLCKSIGALGLTPRLGPLNFERLMSFAGGCITYTTEMCNYSGSFWGDFWLECDFCDESEAGKLFEKEVFGEEVCWDNYEIIFKQTGGL